MVMNEQTDILIQNLQKKSKNQEKFDISPSISNCALDIICGRLKSFSITFK
jgi:hypothetical protein